MSTLTTSQGHTTPDAHEAVALAPDFPDGHPSLDAQTRPAVGEHDLPQANAVAPPRRAAPAGSILGPDHRPDATQSKPVRAAQLPDGQHIRGHQGRSAVGAQTVPQVNDGPAPMTHPPAERQTDRGHDSGDAHIATAPAASPPAGHHTADTQVECAGRGPLLRDPLLALAADMVDDLEKTRIAAENRLRQLTRDEPDADGEMRGFALGDREAAPYAAMVEQLAKVEHAAVLELQRRMRKHPLGPWVASRVGLGPKQTARLLASIGDPYWNDLHDRPRMVSELWAFCGYHVLPVGQRPTDAQRPDADGAKTGSDTGHDRLEAHGMSAGVAAARRRGQRANWSATAKMRAFLIAESCIKQRHSPYRAVYEAGREKYAEAIHPAPCVRCGPAGKPAAAGSALSDGHKHARALRLVAKAVLRDLWEAARDLHEAPA